MARSTAAGKTAPAKRPSKGKPEVQVVVAASGFPISSKTSARSAPTTSPTQQTRPDNNKRQKVFNLIEAKREVRHYGASGFEGEKKESFEDEQYRLLTGRNRKKPPPPAILARKTRKKLKQEREERELANKDKALLEEVPDMVRPRAKPAPAKSRRAMLDAQNRAFGPAPSVGPVKNGVFRLSKRPF